MGPGSATTQPVRLESLEVGDILADPRLAVPEYQRIYCWDTGDITRFWESIRDLDGIHLGSIILYENGDTHEIVDGQQRLMTLSLILQNLSEKKPSLLATPLPALLHRETDKADEIRNIAHAKWVIDEMLFPDGSPENFKNIREKILHIPVTKITVSHEHPDLAYVFFNNQNSKGQELTDFDLLKAHHLRFIAEPEAAENVAQGWARMQAQMAAYRDEKPALHHALGFLVYRLRKLVRRQEYGEYGHYVQDEFQSTAWPKQMPPAYPPLLDARPEMLMYHSPIAGGRDFFVFAQKFFDLYKRFEATAAATKLEHFSSRHKYLYDMAECLLFAYYLKFGSDCLAEALFCICAVLGHYRYALPRVTKDSIEMTRESDLIYLIDQAPSPEFFLAQALGQVERLPAAISPKNTASKSPGSGKGSGWKKGDPIFTLQHAREARNQNVNTVKTDYYATLCRICQKSSGEFSIEAIKTAIKNLYPPQGKSDGTC